MQKYQIRQADCFDWLRACPPQTIHAVCTDPPYGLIEFSEKELSKLRNGRGGVWRLPPAIGGHKRDPLPRFTVLTDEEKLNLRAFFRDWGKLPENALPQAARRKDRGRKPPEVEDRWLAASVPRQTFPRSHPQRAHSET